MLMAAKSGGGLRMTLSVELMRLFVSVRPSKMLSYTSTSTNTVWLPKIPSGTRMGAVMLYPAFGAGGFAPTSRCCTLRNTLVLPTRSLSCHATVPATRVVVVVVVVVVVDSEHGFSNKMEHGDGACYMGCLLLWMFTRLSLVISRGVCEEVDGVI